MTTLKQTSGVARALGVSEWRVRDLRRRGLLVASVRTEQGLALHTDADISSAKEFLAKAGTNRRFSSSLDSRK